MTTAIQTNIFDFTALDSETRIVVQQEDKEYDRNMGDAGSNFLRACHNLKRIHDALRYKRPGFVDYSRSKQGLATATAYRMIDVAKMFPESRNIYIDSKEALYLLASPNTPESVRAEIIDRAEQGETITYSETRDQIGEAQEARRYDGFAAIPAPDGDNEPLNEYEQQIAAQYNERYTPDPEPSRMSQPMSLLTAQGTVEWYTPPNLIERARAVLGAIDLDPASSDVAQQWIKATKYHTIETPSQEAWSGRVWLNPPFNDTDTWVDRLDGEYLNGDVTAAVLLVNSAPGYIWWENLWRRRPICMLRERLPFWTPKGKQDEPAKKGTTIAYYGDDVTAFKRAFSDLGRIILPEY